MIRYAQLRDLIDECKPQTIIEVGTCHAARAVLMCLQALQHRPKVHYTGFDLFEDATPEINKAEMNGKSPTTDAQARIKLDGLQRAHPGFTYELIKGNTRSTLHGGNFIADFVFIDGGHSIETIRGDYEALKGSKVIVFDDFYPMGVDTTKYGCNALLSDIPHRILPLPDTVKGGGIVQMAVRL